MKIFKIVLMVLGAAWVLAFCAGRVLEFARTESYYDLQVGAARARVDQSAFRPAEEGK